MKLTNQQKNGGSLTIPVPKLKDGPFSDIQFTFCNVTPHIASVWLKKNVKNRRIKESTLRGYVMDMRNGAWLTTHQGIAFDASGNLLDGQHRLMAIVEANIPVLMVVSTGWPVAMDPKHMTMDAVDRGTARSLGDQLHLQHGIEPREANLVVKICNALGCLSTGNLKTPKASTDSILTVFSIYKNEIKWILSNPVNQQGLRSKDLLAVCVMARAVFDPAKVQDFIDRIMTGENLARDNPVLPLRNWMLNHIGRDARSYEGRFAICHHLLSFVENKPCASLVMNSNLAYLKILELSQARVQKIRAIYQELQEDLGRNIAAGQNREISPKMAKEMSAHDLPVGSMVRKVYYEALRAPVEFTSASLSVAIGNSADSVGIALVQLERKALVKKIRMEDGENIYSIK